MRNHKNCLRSLARIFHTYNDAVRKVTASPHTNDGRAAYHMARMTRKRLNQTNWPLFF